MRSHRFRTVVSCVICWGLIFGHCGGLAEPVVFGAFGPCSVTTPASYSNTITCVSGSCTGMVLIVPEQKACAGTDKILCTPGTIDLLVTYSSVGTDLGLGTYIYCCGVSDLCLACAATLGAVCAYSNGAAYEVCLVAAGCGVCAAAISCDHCCHTSCAQDLTTRIAVPGGSTC